MTNNLPRIWHNVASLGVVQLAGYVLPLITLPYLTRVLGVNAWGTVAWVQIIVGYFTLFTNWGFAMSATRKVAANRNEPERISDIFFATWVAQWLLCAIAIMILAILMLTVPFFMRYAIYFLWGIGLIISSVLFPIWLLTGLEHMKHVAVFQLATRVAAVPLIFLLVRDSQDAPLTLAIGAMTGILGGALTIAWISKHLSLTWRWPSKSRILEELREGAAIFGSTIWISLYTSLIPTVLGIVVGNTAVGYYALADRVRQVGQSALSPISQALFPRMSLLFEANPAQARNLLLRSSKITLSISATVSFMLWFFAENIVLILAGEDFRQSISVLEWLAPLPFVISLSNIAGVQIMLPNHKIRAFSSILFVAGALSLVMIFPLVQWRGEEGASINVLITECFVTLAMALYLWKNRFFLKIRIKE